MYALIQLILGFVNYFTGTFENTQMGFIEDGGVLTFLIQGLALRDLGSMGLTIEDIGATLLQLVRYEAIATFVITVLVVWLICKLICRIFDC